MAASLTRPDPSSPSSVADAGFSTARRGYQQDEVRAFLTSVAAELSRVQDRVHALESELADLRAAGGVASADLDEDTVASLLGEETVRVLQTARESASEIKVRAEENAARILREATEAAQRTRHDADVESARRRQDAASDAEAEIALAKQQGREMVNEARAYRERVLADLERRTTLARNQIEELLHGRDRLLQVFERARLVAVDVTSELQAVDSPEELVNLAPTTGPVPVMVPNAPRPDAAVEPEAVTEPEIVEPEAVEPEAVEPEAVEPEAVEPEAVEPEIVEPEAVEADTGVAPEAEQVDVEAEESDTNADTSDDTNVVELFGPRDGEAVDGDDEDHDDEDHDDEDHDDEDHDDETADVDGLFARLRDEVSPTGDDTDTDIDTDIDTDTDPVAATESDEPMFATAFQRRDEALVPLIVAGARKLKRVLADEQNGVLDALGGKTPVTELGDVLPEPATHAQQYADALRDELVIAAGVGAAEIDESATPSATALATAEQHLASDLIAPLRDRLERAIADGAPDNDAVSRTIRSIYREWKTQHIDDQLDDVFRFAHGGGIIAAADRAPLVWTIDPAHGAGPDCEDNSLAGPTAAGEAYPTGHTAAPAHPGCRCLTLPAAR